MNRELQDLIDRLAQQHSLSLAQYEQLLAQRSSAAAAYLAQLADEQRQRHYGRQVFIRGLIEISNICKNDCLYCGIRRSNRNCQRYRLTAAQILDCCAEGYRLGFRSFVLQGGEDGFFSDEWLLQLIRQIKAGYPDCALTLSLGERSYDSYRRLRAAGADRYLLRHETADADHYVSLHPQNMSYRQRMQCLHWLRELGFQTGCGFMVGSPGQTLRHLAQDLKFIEQFRPDMCGIGPFIPHRDTPFAHCAAGSVELSCYLLSVIRLIHPPVLLPATTALGTLDEQGREKAILAGANVVMPNLSPPDVRSKYQLYDNKLSDGAESAQSKHELVRRMQSIGYQVVVARGDVAKVTDICN